MIGRTLSHYRILHKLGSGGMGEVYAAEDTKLGRKVALKVLPPETASNAERLERFEQEARVVAALNHPNIVTVFSVEECEDVHFITMELVEGKTLTELIPKNPPTPRLRRAGGLPLNKFLEIAIPLADAVSTAHEKGIIHRDLKPDNLMVSDSGRLKILDFGLAKLKPEFADSGVSELPTRAATQEGLILGTVAYMSPEQAEGKSLDHRTDIFSAGTVLYEMATGRRPFDGDTAAAVLSSIIKDTPDSVNEHNPNIPRDLGKIIRRCLAKDITRRYQTALDLRNELEELKQEVDSGELQQSSVTGRPPARKKWAFAVALAIAVASILTYFLTLTLEETAQKRSSPPKVSFTRLTSSPGRDIHPSLSPDGNFVVFSRRVSDEPRDIFLQRVGGENAINLTSSPSYDTQPAFSPDGERIAFRSDRDGGGIFVMGATGESVRRLTTFGANPTWSPDGARIAFATYGVHGGEQSTGPRQIWTVDVETGESKLVHGQGGLQPHWSPNGRRIAFWKSVWAGSDTPDIWTVPAFGGDAAPVTNDHHSNVNPIWSADGKHLFFCSDRGGTMSLWRVPIEEESGEVLGNPELVATAMDADVRLISISRDGHQLAYSGYVQNLNLQQVTLDPLTGDALGEPRWITRGSTWFEGPSASSTGEWIAATVYPVRRSGMYSGQGGDIVVVRTDGTSQRELTDDSHMNRFPRWSPDGSVIAYLSRRSGTDDIWTIRPDGSGQEQVTDTPGVSMTSLAWSPDGVRIVYSTDTPRPSNFLISVLEPQREQTPQELPRQGGSWWRATSWSPDGNYLAGYGPEGIWLADLTTQEQRQLTSFGAYPAWLADNRSLLFHDRYGVYKLDSMTGDYHQILTVAPDNVSGPLEISRDGTRLYFSFRVRYANIWLLTLEQEH
jgi:serine/threonine protein kinase